MSEFKVGTFLVRKYIPETTIYKVKKIQNENQVYVEYDSGGCKQHSIIGNSLLYQATVLDYIRTLDENQLTKFLHKILTCCLGFNRCTKYADCWIYQSKHNYGFDKQLKAINQWLTQPLTDELVRELGGIEE